MNAAISNQTGQAFTSGEGLALLSANEAILKGILESQVAVSLIAGPRVGAFAGMFRLTGSGSASATLREHGIRVVAAPDATRALTLAGQSAQSGQAAIALVPCDRLDGAIPELTRLCAEPLPRGAALAIVLEDDPISNPASCPRRTAQRLGLAAVEVANVERLRDAMESVLLLSRSSRCVIGLVVHSSVLRSADTLELRSNRVGGVVEVLRERLHRRVRPGIAPESFGHTAATAPLANVLRSSRRLELNQYRAMPSPGERVSFGFITIGPSEDALMHLVDVLQLHGRVPILHLQLIQPVDDAVVGRLLLRCENVIVLEPRPGVLETEILLIAEQLRRNDQEPATVWGQRVPPRDDGEHGPLASHADIHPSVLARRITHLLHAIRPSAQVASHLAPSPPATPRIPPRESAIGAAAALQEVRRLLRDTDQWLRDQAPLSEREIPPTTLAIDGAEPASSTRHRVVMVETWDHRRFLRCGAPAIVQAARDDRPWLLIACESAGEDVSDLERMARGVIPADRADRVTLESTNLSDLVNLRDRVREAVMRDGMTVLIVRDGPPARYDVAAIDSAAAEIDRLGFEPRQRLIQSVDEICAIRPTVTDDELFQRASAGPVVRTETSIERVSDRVTTRFRLRVKPILEEAEVTRVRPPPLRWRTSQAARLPTPQILHGSQPRWRVHLAGIRGEAPAAAPLVLIEAGRAMKYHVRSVQDLTPIGPGRRAWTQILFTRPRTDDQSPHMTAVIPFGEADLLLGMDGRESLRAVSPDFPLRVASDSRTCAVVNTSPFIDDHDFEAPTPTPEAIAASVAAVSMPGQSTQSDFATICRTWFHTDRLSDMAMLGVAYQKGCIPVSAEAMEAGLVAAEARGFARAREAFTFGRRLSIDTHLSQSTESGNPLPLHRLARQLSLSIGRRRGSSSRARELAALLNTSLEQMPGLAETDAGRQASRDFIMACHHCAVWGGLTYAETYADLITRLYQIDRGDTGRLLTRTAVLPLAESMLIRDLLYIAGLTASAEHRRRVRDRLHAKRSRGDEIERRYLTRIDWLVMSRRIRMDVRTSDWPTRLIAALRRVVPVRLRGSRRERQLRDYMLDLVRKAIISAPHDHERWSAAMQRLHDQAAESRLRGMAMAEVRMLTGIDGPSPASL